MKRNADAEVTWHSQASCSRLPPVFKLSQAKLTPAKLSLVMKLQVNRKLLLLFTFLSLYGFISELLYAKPSPRHMLTPALLRHESGNNILISVLERHWISLFPKMLNRSFKEVCVLCSIACGTEGNLIRGEDTTQKAKDRRLNAGDKEAGRTRSAYSRIVFSRMLKWILLTFWFQTCFAWTDTQCECGEVASG